MSSQPCLTLESKPPLVSFHAFFYDCGMSRIFLLTCLVGLGAWSSSVRAEWPQFRGPLGAAVYTGERSPSHQPAVAWTASLPGRGLSAPIVLKDKVFVTCSSGAQQDSLHVLCFSAKTGELLWQRIMRATGRTMTHEKTCVAAPTPCSDGTTVFALFSSNDLFAFDLDGDLKWLRGLTFDYSNASNSLGMSQSPLVLGGTLVVQSENDAESFAAGLDLKTGRNVWKLERPKAANWTSAIPHGGAVALQSSQGLLALNPASGETAWSYADGASTIPSSVATADAVYAVSKGITALAPDTSGSVSQLWRNEGLKPGTASPLVLGDHLYVVNNAGVLIQANRNDGTENWKLRLKGPFSGSPVAAGQYLYITNERGIFQVVDTKAPEGEVVYSIELGETVLTTAAISDGALFVRSDGKLWKLE
jgi:outer membrane protein assembly factor BamB